MPANPPAVPGLVDFCAGVAARAASASGDHLLAGYLHGSAVLGGWMPGRSDVDLLLVSSGAPGEGVGAVLADVLVSAGTRCPGSRLECSVVTAEQARRPAPPWPFVVHVVAGPPGGERRVVPGGRGSADPDLLMHYAVCRSAGVAVAGPAPAEVIGDVARELILPYLAHELAWGVAQASEEYAVLNACRALVYLCGGGIVSKIAGAERVIAERLGPVPLIELALARQRGLLPSARPGAAAAEFASSVAARLLAAS